MHRWPPPRQVVRFGAFELNVRSGELRKHGIRLKLQDQPLQVLTMLLERRGDVVTRDELRQKLWSADTFVDFDAGLNSAVKKLRSALGDSAENHSYIETLPRRGYRFSARWTEDPEDGGKANDLGDDLAELKQEVTTTPRWIGGLGRYLVVATAALVFLLLAVYVARRPERVPPPRTRLIQLTSQAGVEFLPSLSPDGEQFLYVSGASGNDDIYFQRVGGQKPINLTEDSLAADVEPAFSPDGARIAFRSDRDGGGIFVMGATGESVKRVTNSGFNPAWSSDGEFLAFSTEGVWNPNRDTETGELRVARVATGEVRVIEVKGDAVQPSWSPHGNRIAFWSHTLSDRNYRDIWTVPAQGGDVVPVTQDEHVDWNPVWSPTGEYLYFSSNRGGTYSLWRVLIDEETGITKGDPEVVTATDAARILQISVARDGRRLAYQANLSLTNLYKIAFDPESEVVLGELVPIVTGSHSVLFPDVSPDRRWVAFSFFLWGGQADLAVAGTDGTRVHQLTEEPHFSNLGPRWSPDGDELVFYSNRSGNLELWSIRPDGSHLRRLTDARSRITSFVWSPDGLRIAYSSDGDWYLFQPALPWDGQKPEKLPRPQEGSFEGISWSSDGKRFVGSVYYSSRAPRIAIFALDSREYEVLPVEGESPLWLSDGRRVLFNNGDQLLVLDVKTGRVKKVLERVGLVAHVGSGLAMSHDDREIYFGVNRREGDIWMVTLQDGGER